MNETTNADISTVRKIGSGVPVQELIHINESGRTGLLKVLSAHLDIAIITPVSV